MLLTSNTEQRYRSRQARFAYRTIAPSVLFVTLFIILPLLYSVAVAFRHYEAGAARGFAGLRNFREVFTGPTIAPSFYDSLWTTMKFTVPAVVAVIVVSFFAAVVMHHAFAGSRLVKIALLLPYAIPGVVSAVIWDWMFDGSFGVINGVLMQLGFIDSYINFTANTWGALAVIWFAYVWNFIPYSAFIFSAGLATIPESVYEAARLDNAGPVRRFTKVTLPMMRPVLQIALMVQTIFALVMHFSLVFVMTQGGPASSTRTLPWLIYEDTFSFGRFGRGAAMSLVLAAIMIVFIYVYLVVLNPERQQRRLQRRRQRAASAMLVEDA